MAKWPAHPPRKARAGLCPTERTEKRLLPTDARAASWPTERTDEGKDCYTTERTGLDTGHTDYTGRSSIGCRVLRGRDGGPCPRWLNAFPGLRAVFSVVVLADRAFRGSAAVA